MKNISYNHRLISLLVLSVAAITAFAFEPIPQDEVKHIVRKDSVVRHAPLPEEMVIVGKDTIPMIIPAKNYGRFDRGIFNYLYIPKRHWAYGLTASYGSLDTEDIQVLSAIKDFNFKGEQFSIRPSVSYFFDHNQSVGVRIVYTNGKAELGSLAVDIDDDMNFSLHDVSYHANSSQFGVFYRNYVGLSDTKRFAVFNEVAFDVGTGSSRFKRYYNDELFDTNTKSTMLGLTFSPGLCVFLQDQIAFNLSFGVFGLKYNHDKQETNGVNEGSRTSSGANFRFNIFNINFGLLVVI